MMAEEIVKVTQQQFSDVQRMLQRAHLPNPWGADILDVEKVKEMLRELGVKPKDNITYRFAVI